MNYKRNNKLDLIKIKYKGHHQERQATEWKKIFANYLSDKDLVSRIYK